MSATAVIELVCASNEANFRAILDAKFNPQGWEISQTNDFLSLWLVQISATAAADISKLDCANIGLIEFKSELPEGLKSLDCSGNSMECLPALPASLETINAAGVYKVLTALPEGFEDKLGNGILSRKKA